MSKKTKTGNPKLDRYEAALLDIAEIKCEHEDAKSIGAAMEPPCPACIAWAAINPTIAQIRIATYIQLSEAATAMGRKTEPLIVVPGGYTDTDTESRER